MKIKNKNRRITINIYHLMMLCGLNCQKRSNRVLSHQAVIRKLKLRSKSYPESIIIPTSVAFDTVTCEKICTGQILLVKDDFGKIVPYLRPMTYHEEISMSDEEREEVRSRLIDEYLKECENDNNELKPGEFKYIERQKSKKKKMEGF